MAVAADELQRLVTHCPVSSGLARRCRIPFAANRAASVHQCLKKLDFVEEQALVDHVLIVRGQLDRNTVAEGRRVHAFASAVSVIAE